MGCTYPVCEILWKFTGSPGFLLCKFLGERGDGGVQIAGQLLTLRAAGPGRDPGREKQKEKEMKELEKEITQAVRQVLQEATGTDYDGKVLIQETRREFEGDLTVVVFSLAKVLRRPPEEAGAWLGEQLVRRLPHIARYNVIKGFLNLVVDGSYWVEFLNKIRHERRYGLQEAAADAPTVVIEYSSPNTNKPLHLGHVRNNLIGYSLSRIMAADGNRVVKTNIVNDRGIHICKSMLAWQKWGNGITPEKAGKKGDFLVGDFYVKFEQEYRKQVEQMVAGGMPEEEAKKKAPLLLEAQEMLRRWEAGDPEVIRLWKMMNGWVYEGFDVTYKALGVDFDKIYYESDTYKVGKKIVLDALEKGIVYRREDGSVWADLRDEGLDEKVLLRSDGTAVYMTQDLGTALLRWEDYHFDKHIYVVGNEQNYHFQVLRILMKKLGYPWADRLIHLSYGMVELPEGKMKSREGKVVDADDLIAGMIETAREMGEELGKLEGLDEKEKEEVYRKIGLGALKYFILKIDPKKNIVFNPRESIDFNGNTGPFIQYTYARIRSVLRKAADRNVAVPEQLGTNYLPNEKETLLVRLLARFPQVRADAAAGYDPALVANFAYETAKAFNQFYHDYSILNETEAEARNFRLVMTLKTGEVLHTAMGLLGIEMPERM